ncbi:T9SS type A sorting domain-containing protein, partial [Bacteroidales bacterium OttesenSCG-928-J16]|nr:T9SS type A sorting domain-containing protein [Bacteroidales bacterium OttesenSCG-928-J16]
MGILLYTFLKSSHLQKPADKNENLIITSILCAVCLVTGYTFVDHNKNENTQYITEGKNVNIKVENSVFSEFLTLSKDSTYLIFTFSYGCPHCYNSIENLKQYERLGVVDRVLALSFTADSATIMKFNEIFNPNFQIKNYPPAQLFQLTNQFPTSYYIKDKLYFETDKQIQNVQIFDLNGRMIQEVKVSGDAIDVQELASGVYLVKI